MVEALRDPVRSYERDLHRLARKRFHAIEFRERHIARELELAHDRPPMRDRRSRTGEIRDVPPAQGIAALGAFLMHLEVVRAGVIAANRKAEAVLEVEPAHLAVGDHIEAN